MREGCEADIVNARIPPAEKAPPSPSTQESPGVVQGKNKPWTSRYILFLLKAMGFLHLSSRKSDYTDAFMRSVLITSVFLCGSGVHTAKLNLRSDSLWASGFAAHLL